MKYFQTKDGRQGTLTEFHSDSLNPISLRHLIVENGSIPAWILYLIIKGVYYLLIEDKKAHWEAKSASLKNLRKNPAFQH